MKLKIRVDANGGSAALGRLLALRTMMFAHIVASRYSSIKNAGYVINV
jgi:hypothetical protein